MEHSLNWELLISRFQMGVFQWIKMLTHLTQPVRATSQFPPRWVRGESNPAPQRRELQRDGVCTSTRTAISVPVL